MKIFILIGVILLLCIAGNSQNVITNKEPLVSADAGRILYRGIDNVVTISTGEYKNAQLEIKNGRIRQANGSTYIVVPRPDTTATIINIKTPAKTYEFVFQLKDIPDPKLVVADGGYMEGVLINFKGSKGVSAYMEDFYYKGIFRVENFQISFSGTGFDSTVVHLNKGATWDTETTALIDKCRAGSSILIENVVVLGPDGRRRHLNEKLTCLLR